MIKQTKKISIKMLVFFYLQKGGTMHNSFIDKMAVLYQAVPSSLYMSIRLAQSILESSWGQSELARNANNFAGIKADKNWTGDVYIKNSAEEIDGEVIMKESAFRKYETVEDFVKDHSTFITSSPWRKDFYSAVINAQDYKEQAHALTKTYATDSGYGKKLIDIIERYDLSQYDKKGEIMAKHLVICGHGQGPRGYDPGAVNRHKNLNEAALVRELADRMRNYSGNEIDYIKDKNVYEYGNIATLGRGYASITELHFNAFNGSAKGTEVLIFQGYAPDNMDKKLLEVGARYFVNRGFKKVNNIANVVRTAQAGLNYRLVEVCFIDNNADIDTYYQNIDAIAKGYVEAILNRQINATSNTLNQGATVKTERGGTETPATPPSAFRELKKGDFATIRKQATHYETGQEIKPHVNGQTYVIDDVKAVDKFHSKRAYKIKKDNVVVGWVLELDVLEAWQVDEPKPPQKESVVVPLNGKQYKIEEI